MIKKITCTLIIGAALASSVSASLLVYEGFDYGATDGSLTGLGSDANGWGTNTYTGTGAYYASGLTYTTAGGTLQTTGGAAGDGDSSDHDFMRNYTATIDTSDGSSVWFSYLAFWDNAKNNGIRFGDNSSQAINGGGFGTQSGLNGAASEQSMTAWNGGGANPANGNVSTNGALDLSASSVTHFVLGKVTFSDTASNDTLQVWWDIDLAETEGTLGAADASMTGVNIDITSSTLNFSSGGGAEAITDEIRLGTTFGDVVVIPEPATMGMVVAMGGGILFIRRRLMM